MIWVQILDFGRNGSLQNNYIIVFSILAISELQVIKFGMWVYRIVSELAPCICICLCNPYISDTSYTGRYTPVLHNIWYNTCWTLSWYVSNIYFCHRLWWYIQYISKVCNVGHKNIKWNYFTSTSMHTAPWYS